MSAVPGGISGPAVPTATSDPGRTEAPGGNTGSPWLDWARVRCGQIEHSGRWRSVRDFDAVGQTGRIEVTDPATGEKNGVREVVSFASNDYLGLSHHPDVVRAAHEALDRWGAGSGSSRLIVGSRPVHSELESELAQWKGTERSVLFPTGFAANLGVLAVLGGPDATVYSDELNHASIVDGCRMSRSGVEVFRHRDAEHLGALLAQSTSGRSIVVSDSVFSMDGDVADVDGLIGACNRHGALLVLDEAHAVMGPDPDPAAMSPGALVRIGTLSKTLGSQGGFVACAAPIADLIVNLARPYIFTTAPSPSDAAAALGALKVLRSEEGATLIVRLAGHVDRVLPGHPTPIIPIIIGAEEDAVRISRALLDRGVLIPAIRPPTVPEGTSRLRVSLSADQSDGDVDLLVSELQRAGITMTAWTDRP